MRRTDLSFIPPYSELQHTSRWTREKLKAWRKVGDETADKVVEELHRTQGLPNIRDLLGTVKEGAAAGRPYCIKFMQEVDRMPEWVNPQMVERGQQVQAAYSSLMGPALFAGSLVGGSMFKSAALVTAMAGNFTDEPARRTNETALIIANLIFPGALLRPGGRSREALIRVRLLHGGLRHWLPDSGRYTRTDEVPINQHDLAIVLALFGYVNLRSLCLMGAKLMREEIDAYIHMWRYAGYILGIDEELLSASLEDQEEFFLASCVDEAKPEWIPRGVTRVLDDVAKNASVSTFGMLPYDVAQTMLHQLTRYLSGNDFCIGMQIPDLGNDHWALRLARLSGFATSVVIHYVPFGEKTIRAFTIAATRRAIAAHEKHQKLGSGMNVAPNALAKL